ncbi:pseudouridine synthase [Glonium stellatum]|uniref:tRNA pseudouridine synthase 1 n=1 Tax=Glonium stellatum TaxID=574774 RepID=A0A8E2JWL7_9PEZI|nr:pseudouridine synthase [Glonium stellatum]
MDSKPTENEAPESARNKSIGENVPDQQRGGPGGNDRKRKWEVKGKLQHGSRGGDKKKNLGRRDHFREQLDRRGRNEAEQSKRRKIEEDGKKVDSVLPSAFSKDEIDAEERKPKRKVAVLLGYSGTGYKGMQIDTTQKTIEGDLFTAFVAAGAISKANADDPKKSSLVRCARTDKGVHAAGNVISLKLIIEDEDIVERINSHLSPQIRIWGIERTTGAFSCYQACDSRWYEYLIPSHSFLPPHPSSFLGKKLVELAEKASELEEYNKRQEEVAHFWPEVEENHIKPILETLDGSIRLLIEKALYEVDGIEEGGPRTTIRPKADKSQPTKTIENPNSEISQEAHALEEVKGEPSLDAPRQTTEAAKIEEARPGAEGDVKGTSSASDLNSETNPHYQTANAGGAGIQVSGVGGVVPLPDSTPEKKALEAAMKPLKKAYINARKSYRISPARIARLQEVLDRYLGTKNYHNYTTLKRFKDPSAKRHIKSFTIGEKPIMINGTEWLSLKVHGQSFMMHQIRKMVGMAALVVRCGCPTSRITESFKDVNLSIPRVPGLGLLLERPVFDSYNTHQAEKHGRERIDFNKYEQVIEDFKQREIYERIFREEEEGNYFNTFFTHIDNYKEPTFFYLTSGGIAATQDPTRGGKGKSKHQDKWNEIESEDDAEGGEE